MQLVIIRGLQGLNSVGPARALHGGYRTAPKESWCVPDQQS